MTLKYESEILFDLMKRDGDDTPSDVLPYESELKEKYLQQVEGGYPKLMDYRPEWLNYNLNAHLPADFPVESVSNVTNATFENVVPYVYGSAILKGQTLVNIIDKISFTTSNRYFNIVLKQYEVNKNYLLVIFNAPNGIAQIYVGNSSATMKWRDYTTDFIRNGSTISLKVTCPSNYDGSTIVPHFKYESSEPSLDELKQTKTMLIPYQEGMENWDIPYFEGMQSVKMPVLTTSNEDGTKTNILTVNEDVELRGIGEVQDTIDCLTGGVTERIGEIVLDGSEDWYQDNNGFTRFKTQIQNGCAHTSRSEIVSNFFPFMSSANANSYPLAFIYASYLYVYLEENTTVDSLKEWLKENKPTIQYKLETPAIKTVDLTVTDQDGNTASIIRPIEGTMNVSTSSQTIPPLLDMSVPIEATSQNLMSFANIVEGE